MQSLSRLASAIGFFLGGILILASFFIISNVIKLNVFSRKDEIEILRMSGATNTFIRIPFLLEGVVLGFLGGLLSLLLLLVLIRIFPRRARGIDQLPLPHFRPEPEHHDRRRGHRIHRQPDLPRPFPQELAAAAAGRPHRHIPSGVLSAISPVS